MSVGGIFGVMNTMFAAISQRIGDIGVLRLLGYARWQILVSFLLESLADRLGGRTAGLRTGLAERRLDGHEHRRRGHGGGKSVVLQLADQRRHHRHGHPADAVDGPVGRPAAGAVGHAAEAAGSAAIRFSSTIAAQTEDGHNPQRRMRSRSGWGTGPFFGEKSCSARTTSAENMDLSPSRGARGTVPFSRR